MSRTHRLFQLMQHLRRLPPPVTAQQLADDMDVSLRTVYRDIDALRGLGAVIDGEAGFGFTLIEDATLPPLSKAAESALVKIQARVPPRQAHRLKHAILDAHRFHRPATPTIDVGKLRAATWEEVCVRFSYSDAQSQLTERTVRPLGIVYFDHNNVLLAWCLLRQDFRTFRLDRMNGLERTDISFRPHRVALLRQHLERIRADQERNCLP